MIIAWSVRLIALGIRMEWEESRILSFFFFQYLTLATPGTRGSLFVIPSADNIALRFVKLLCELRWVHCLVVENHLLGVPLRYCWKNQMFICASWVSGLIRRHVATNLILCFLCRLMLMVIMLLLCTSIWSQAKVDFLETASSGTFPSSWWIRKGMLLSVMPPPLPLWALR